MKLSFTLLLLFLSLCFSPQLSRAQDGGMREFRAREAAHYAKLHDANAGILALANNYDVHYYRLNVVLLKVPDRFSGDVVTVLESRVASLDTVAFNCAAFMTVDSVVQNGAKLQVIRAGDVLSIPLATPLALNQMTSVRVYYSAPYAGSAVNKQQVQNLDLGETTTSIASQAEPYDARRWWPCKDDPADKADSLDLFYTTDSDIFPVGNGVMVSDIDNGNGTHTVHWTSKYPIVTYLVSVAAAKYTHKSYTFNYGASSMPFESWFYDYTSAQMQPNEQTALDGLRVYSDLFIPYPFMKEKYGMAEYEWGGSMEHQTVTSMGFYGVDVVVHELAHQWFGDKVTCASFEHIWLNEGWATYCEALYREASGGLPALKAKMATTAYYGAGKIYVDDPENSGFNRIFNGNLSYDKGGWVCHMVRHVVGDKAFFAAVKKYLGDASAPNYRSVTTADFQHYLEAESGMDLTSFFQNWIYGEYFPTYRYGYRDSLAAGMHVLTLTVRQILSPATQIFDMPIDVTFRFDGYDSTVVIRNNQLSQTYQFTFPSEVKGVLLDKDDWILKRVSSDVKLDEGILVVNGVDWDVSAYTDDIKAAYADSTFTGNHPYRFWDIFPNPTVGYPPNVAPYGVGNIPADEIGRYCTIVWIGNAYNGDDIVWQNAALWNYISQGGNVILITRSGQNFISGDMKNFLGINWETDLSTPPLQCSAVRGDLVNMDITGDQSLVTPFMTQLTRPENELLFEDDVTFTPAHGLGVRGVPELIDGTMSGEMVYIALRPYRIRRSQLKRNMQTLLDEIVCKNSPSGVGDVPVAARSIALSQNYPNPINASIASSTRIDFEIASPSQHHVMLEVFDALGRVVLRRDEGSFAPGRHALTLPVGNLGAGVYTYQIFTGVASAVRHMIVVR